MAGTSLLAEHFFKLQFQLIAGSGEAAAYGSNVDFENFCDFFVSQFLHFAHHQDCAVLLS